MSEFIHDVDTPFSLPAHIRPRSFEADAINNQYPLNVPSNLLTNNLSVQRAVYEDGPARGCSYGRAA